MIDETELKVVSRSKVGRCMMIVLYIWARGDGVIR